MRASPTRHLYAAEAAARPLPLKWHVSRKRGTARCSHDSSVLCVNDRIYCHVVWTTRHRTPILDAGLATFLSRFLRGVARQEQAHILEMGMVATHVHILLRIAPTTRLPRLLQRLKGGSAVIANRERRSTTGIELQWSKGYSIQSVSPRSLIAVRKYLRAQPNHHPRDTIPGWQGDAPEFEPAGQDDVQFPKSVY